MIMIDLLDCFTKIIAQEVAGGVWKKIDKQNKVTSSCFGTKKT